MPLPERTKEEYVTQSFREAVRGLALDPPDQIAAQSPACVMCELLQDYELYARSYLELHESEMTPEVLALIRSLGDFQKSGVAAYECWDTSVLTTLPWEEQRKQARKLLDAFGWPLEKLPGFREVRPGLWKREDQLD